MDSNNDNNLYNSLKENKLFSSDNIINNNYNIKVDEEKLFRRMLNKKYKEDLDNLIKQKKSESQSLPNLNNEDFSKIQRMNDKYNLEKISQQAIIKEYSSYNEKEAQEKQQKLKELKENQYKDYLKQYNTFNYETQLINKQLQEKKEQLRQQVENDLLAYRVKKLVEKENEKKEIDKYITNRVNNDYFANSEKQYHSKISKMNNNIYKNALIYNEYINKGKNNDLFAIKNDSIFNQKVSEMKQNEKNQEKLQIINDSKIQKHKSDLQNMYERQLREQKLFDQQNYRYFLDKQAFEHKNNNNNKNILISSGEQLLMPSYRYSNVPKPLINYTFNRNYSTINSNNFNNEKMIKNFYLGDSTLKHNPITCPVEDFTPKKYIISQLYKQNQKTDKPKNNIDKQLNYLSYDLGK